MLASGGDDGTVVLWNTQSRQLIGEPLKGHDSKVSSVAFSPDGGMLASGGNDGTIILWNTQRLQQGGNPLRFHGGSGVWSMAFSPDSRMLASGGYDGTVILWDADIESWKERACGIANRNLTPSEWKQYLEYEPPHKTCP
jgi:WD40 repeat protein